VTADEKEACRLEEAAIRAALGRSLAQLKDGTAALEAWVKTPKGLPPRDVNRAAFDVQLDIHALLRVLNWRERFG